jgi:hypothetical protein
MTSNAPAGTPTYCPLCGVHPSGRPACPAPEAVEAAPTYVRVSLDDARPGDEVWQAGEWSPVASFHVFGSRRDLVKIEWPNGSTHAMPVRNCPTIRRAVVEPTRRPADLPRELGCYSMSLASGRVCTLGWDHDGDHVAHGPDRIVEVWERAANDRTATEHEAAGFAPIVPAAPVELVEVRVSGAAYVAALDPHATDVPREAGWPEPTRRRQGRGSTFVYSLTREAAADMADHLATLGECFTFEGSVDDPETYREGRACLAAAARIRSTLVEVTR